MPFSIMIVDEKADEFNGTFIEDFDFEYGDGVGNASCTSDPSKAKKFDTLEQAIDYIHTVPKCKPVRDDGLPNKPLTACNLAVGDVS